MDCVQFWIWCAVTLVLTLPCVPAAGVFCAIVSHPADSVVSVLNKEKGSTALQVLKRLGPKGELPMDSHTLTYYFGCGSGRRFLGQGVQHVP